MKKVLKIGSKTIPVWLLIAIIVAAAVASASVIIATIQTGYTITPTAAEAPTMNPNTLNLDLGTIPSGSSGTKEFSKVATLDLPVGYEITLTLDTTTTSDFTTFNVYVYLYEPGATYHTYYFFLQKGTIWEEYSLIIDAGTYDVTVEIEYTAVSVASETTGNVRINVSYPG